MIEEILNRLSKRFIAKGCPEEILDQAAKEQSVECLPEAYRKFMGAFGDRCNSILGDSCSCTMLQEGGYKNVLIYELKQIGVTLPEDSFVFYCHDGYVWYFFRTKDCADDPPVYCYWEPDPGIRVIAGSFSQLLKMRLDGQPLTRQGFAKFFNYNAKKDLFYPIKTDKEEETI